MYRLKLSSADNMQTSLGMTSRLKQESTEEEPAHNKASQSDPSRGLSNNTNNKPGHLILWQAQIKVFHTKNLTFLTFVGPCNVIIL